MRWYYHIVSLNGGVWDGEGNEVELMELVPSGENVEQQVMLRELLNELPPRVLEIGGKLLEGTPLTKREKIYIHNFRQRHGDEYLSAL